MLDKDAIVTVDNFTELLRAAGVDESQFAVRDWVSSVASAAGVVDGGRTITAQMACNTLKNAGAREMAQKMMNALSQAA